MRLATTVDIGVGHSLRDIVGIGNGFHLEENELMHGIVETVVIGVLRGVGDILHLLLRIVIIADTVVGKRIASHKLAAVVGRLAVDRSRILRLLTIQNKTDILARTSDRSAGGLVVDELSDNEGGIGRDDYFDVGAFIPIGIGIGVKVPGLHAVEDSGLKDDKVEREDLAIGGIADATRLIVDLPVRGGVAAAAVDRVIHLLFLHTDGHILDHTYSAIDTIVDCNRMPTEYGVAIDPAFLFIHS